MTTMPAHTIQKVPSKCPHWCQYLHLFKPWKWCHVQLFYLGIFLLFFTFNCISVLFCFYREKLQPGRQFSEAALQPQMYSQAALWGYITYMLSINQFPVRWIRNRHLNNSYSARFPTERASHLWSACWFFFPSLVFMSCPYLLGVFVKTGSR